MCRVYSLVSGESCPPLINIPERRLGGKCTHALSLAGQVCCGDMISPLSLCTAQEKPTPLPSAPAMLWLWEAPVPISLGPAEPECSLRRLALREVEPKEMGRPETGLGVNNRKQSFLDLSTGLCKTTASVLISQAFRLSAVLRNDIFRLGIKNKTHTAVQSPSSNSHSAPPSLLTLMPFVEYYFQMCKLWTLLRLPLLLLVKGKVKSQEILLA